MWLLVYCCAPNRNFCCCCRLLLFVVIYSLLGNSRLFFQKRHNKNVPQIGTFVAAYLPQIGTFVVDKRKMMMMIGPKSEFLW